MSKSDMRGLNNKEDPNEDQDEEEKVSFFARITGLRDKLKLGPHHKMERFTIVLCTSLSFLLLFTSLAFVNHRSSLADMAVTQALYSEDFTFSLSNQRGVVQGAYGNKDRTDVMVLFHMQDSQSMSLDAENYELFITSDKKNGISYTPEVSFSLFGSTGYGIIRFQNDTPLPQEILNVTIRANSIVSVENGGAGSQEGQDSSFNDFDQATLYVNPGAEDVTVIDGMKAGEDDPIKLYTALVAEPLDEAIHDKIDAKSKEAERLLIRMSEYSNRLVKAGYTPPPTPWFVEGDYVDEDGVFRPANDLDRAYDFDYTTKNIRDGYLKQVIKDMSEFEAYIAKQSTVNESADKESERQERVENVSELKHTDGSTLILESVNTGTSPSAQIAAKDSVATLEATWDTYRSVKAEIQRALLHELIILDADVQSQPSGYSEHKGESAVWFY